MGSIRLDDFEEEMERITDQISEQSDGAQFNVTKDSVRRFSISVNDYRTSYGALVLLPAQPFRDHLNAVYDLG